MPSGDGDMEGDDGKHPAGDYRQARIGASVALVFAIVILVIADPLLPTYEVSPAILMAMLGAVAALLGVDLLPPLRK